MQNKKSALIVLDFLKLCSLGLVVFLVLVQIALIFLPRFGIEFYTISSNSMSPSLKIDDVVCIKRKDVEVGDIITFKQNFFGTLTHRVISIREANGKIYYLCAGDNSKLSYEIESQTWQERVEHFNNLKDEQAFAECENVVEENSRVGVVVLNFAGLNKILKNRFLILTILVLIVLYKPFYVPKYKIKNR